MTQPTPQECLATFDEIARLLLAGETGQALELSRRLAFDLSISLNQGREDDRNKS